MFDKSKIKKILVVSLSNIGDVILTFPVIDILMRDFPDTQIDVVVGPKAENLIKGHPGLRKVSLYRREQSPVDTLKWLQEMKTQHYDLAVDLRNSAIPFLVFAKHKTPLMIARPKGHMRQQHLSRLKLVYDYSSESRPKEAFFISENDKNVVGKLLNAIGSFVVIAPGSRAENKRWREDGFAKLADYLGDQYNVKIVFVGDENDIEVVARIKSLMKNHSLDLTNQLTLAQLGGVLTLSRLAVVNDSAPMHLASYLDVPVAAFFGPTDPKKYGPWGKENIVIQKNGDCAACHGKKNYLHDCMQAIGFEDAFSILESWLKGTLNGK